MSEAQNLRLETSSPRQVFRSKRMKGTFALVKWGSFKRGLCNWGGNEIPPFLGWIAATRIGLRIHLKANEENHEKEKQKRRKKKKNGMRECHLCSHWTMSMDTELISVIHYIAVAKIRCPSSFSKYNDSALQSPLRILMEQTKACPSPLTQTAPPPESRVHLTSCLFLLGSIHNFGLQLDSVDHVGFSSRRGVFCLVGFRSNSAALFLSLRPGKRQLGLRIIDWAWELLEP